jgi:hypothetical protein
MSLNTVKLQFFVSESLHPRRFSGHHLTDEEFKKWKSFLRDQVSSLKMMLRETFALQSAQRRKQVSWLGEHLVDLSNTVNGYLCKMHSEWKDHPQSSAIRIHYLFTCELFEGFLTWLRQHFPVEGESMLISNFAIPVIKMELKVLHGELTDHLMKNEIEGRLSQIVLKGLFQLIEKRPLHYNERQYVLYLLGVLLDKKDWNAASFKNELIINDFNFPDFFFYCVEVWEKQLEDLAGLHEQQEMIVLEKDKLHGLFLHRGLRQPFQPTMLSDDLDDFLSEKYNFVKELLKLRREVMRDQEKAKMAVRFLVNLPVPQFGLLIRMLVEKGILATEHLGELFGFFAAHFYTANAQFISTDSLLKKSTDVEFANAQKLKAQLIGMLNWLNTKYNLSKY